MKALRRAVARACLISAIVLCLGRVAMAADICPAPKPLPPTEDDMRMKESAFTAKQVGDGIQYFDKDLMKELLEKKTTQEVMDTESFMIGYPNVIKTMKGYVLRQEALVRLMERDLAMEKSRRGRSTKSDVAAAKAAFEEAKRRFCDFLKDAYYTD